MYRPVFTCNPESAVKRALGRAVGFSRGEGGVVGRRGCLRSAATLLGRPFSARATVVGTGRALATAYATSGAVARVARARRRYLGIVRTRLVRRASLRIEIRYNNRRPAEITGKWTSR